MTENDAGASVDKTPERQALEHIVAVLEPLHWQCPDHKCQGCQYEHDEALIVAMNVIAGLDPFAHIGPGIPLRRVDGKLVRDVTPEHEAELIAEGEARRQRMYDAWRAAGFVEDTSGERTMWRRGTAV